MQSEHAEYLNKEEGVGHDIMGSVYLTLCSWFVETSQISIIIKDKATVDVYGYELYIYQDLCGSMNRDICVSYRRGLLRCSFYDDGQCEGLYKRDE